MTCESFALAWGGGWAAYEVSENDGLSIPGMPPPASDRHSCTASRLFNCHQCIAAFAKQTNYRRYLRRHCRRDRQEAEAQEEVHGSLHEFGYSSTSLMDQLVMSTPLTRPTQEAQ